MADDQPSQEIEASLRSETELFKDAIQSSYALANFTIQVTQVLDNKLGEIKEQLVSNKSLKSGSFFCNQNDQSSQVKVLKFILIDLLLMIIIHSMTLPQVVVSNIIERSTRTVLVFMQAMIT